MGISLHVLMMLQETLEETVERTEGFSSWEVSQTQFCCQRSKTHTQTHTHIHTHTHTQTSCLNILNALLFASLCIYFSYIMPYVLYHTLFWAKEWMNANRIFSFTFTGFHCQILWMANRVYTVGWAFHDPRHVYNSHVQPASKTTGAADVIYIKTSLIRVLGPSVYLSCFYLVPKPTKGGKTYIFSVFCSFVMNCVTKIQQIGLKYHKGSIKIKYLH